MVAQTTARPLEPPPTLQRLHEEVQRLMGYRGSDLDQALTLRMLMDRRVVDTFGRFTGLGGGAGVPGPIGVPGPPGGSPPAPDPTPPPTVTGLSASSAITHVIVTWDAPTYTQGHGHGQTNIYAAQRNPGDPQATFSDAVRVTEIPNARTIAAVPSEPNIRWHIWAKWQSKDGYESTTPAGGTNGIVVTTGQDVTHLLQVLSGQVTTTQLATALNTRINLIDAGAGTAGSVDARIAVETTARAAADGFMSALYTVRVQASQGGRTVAGGFGISGTSGGTAGPTIDMGVVANKFWVAAPSGTPGVSDVLPFVIQTAPQTVNGVTIPAGVYMDAAYINNLTAMWARIGTLFTDRLDVAQLNAVNLTLGDGSVGGNLKSTSFASGSVGWRLQPNGNSEFNNTTVRGTVFANSGSFDGTVTIRDPGGAIAFQSGSNLDWNRVSGAAKPLVLRIRSAGYVAITSDGRTAGIHYAEDNSAYSGVGGMWSVVKIDRSTNAASVVGYYDTYNNGSTAAAAMASALNALASTHIVIIFTWDSPATNAMSGGLPSAIYRCGGSSAKFGSSLFSGRSAYILVGIPGMGEGNGLELMATETTNGGHDAWLDTTISIVYGNPILSGSSGKFQINSSNVSTYIANAAIGNAQIGGDIQSDNFVAGSAGWRIRKSGTAEFDAASIRGQLTAGQIAVGTGTAVANNTLSGLGFTESPAGLFFADATIASIGKTVNNSALAFQVAGYLAITNKSSFGGPPEGLYRLEVAWDFTCAGYATHGKKRCYDYFEINGIIMVPFGGALTTPQLAGTGTIPLTASFSVEVHTSNAGGGARHTSTIASVTALATVSMVELKI